MQDEQHKRAPDDFALAVWELRSFLLAYARRYRYTDYEDVVDQSILRALEARAQFQQGTNLKAWLFTILKNTYFSNMRQQRVRDRRLTLIDTPTSTHTTNDALDLADAIALIRTLTGEQQQTVLLISIGMTYSEVGRAVGTCEGTIKSRFSRARIAMRTAILDAALRPPTGSALAVFEQMVRDVTPASVDFHEVADMRKQHWSKRSVGG